MKRVLVTGSNRGIGLALVGHALARGDRVFAACRVPSAAAALRDLQSASGDRLAILELDLSLEQTHARAFAEVEARAGGLDVLVNNAGIYFRHPSVAPAEAHTSIDRFQAAPTSELLRVNALQPMALTRRLLPLLRRGRQPCVAFLSSGMGSIGRKGGGEVEYGYSASKATLNMLARVLASELAPEAIRVVLLDPGWVATDMGTQRAPLQPDDVVPGLWQAIDSLDQSASGAFLNWRGQPVPW
jgi:NAD(P)-dependent dehydrogenase (short-subunit alcohol dehydrogenase family)